VHRREKAMQTMLNVNMNKRAQPIQPIASHA
jgi:hypothetical protein